MSRDCKEVKSLPLLHGQTESAPEVPLLGPDSQSTGADLELEGQELTRNTEQHWDQITGMLELLKPVNPDSHRAAVQVANQFCRQMNMLARHDFPYRLHLRELPEFAAPHVQSSIATTPSQATAHPPTAEVVSHQYRTSSPEIKARLTTEAEQFKTEKLYDEITALIPDTLRSSEELKDLPKLVSLMEEAVYLPTPIDIDILCLFGDQMVAQKMNLRTRFTKLQKLRRWVNQNQEKQPGSSLIKTLQGIIPILHSRFKLEEYSKELLYNSMDFLSGQGRHPEDIARYLAVDGSNIWIQSLMQHVQDFKTLSKESIQRARNKMMAVQQELETILDTMWGPPQDSMGQPSDEAAEARTPGEEPENTEHLDSKGKGAATPCSGQQNGQRGGGHKGDNEVAEEVLDITSLSDTLNHRQEALDSRPSARGSFKQSKKHPYPSEELADSRPSARGSLKQSKKHPYPSEELADSRPSARGSFKQSKKHPYPSEELADSRPSARGSFKQSKKHPYPSEELADSRRKRPRLDNSKSLVTTTNGMDKRGKNEYGGPPPNSHLNNNPFNWLTKLPPELHPNTMPLIVPSSSESD